MALSEATVVWKVQRALERGIGGIALNGDGHTIYDQAYYHTTGCLEGKCHLQLRPCGVFILIVLLIGALAKCIFLTNFGLCHFAPHRVRRRLAVRPFGTNTQRSLQRRWRGRSCWHSLDRLSPQPWSAMRFGASIPHSHTLLNSGGAPRRARSVMHAPSGSRDILKWTNRQRLDSEHHDGSQNNGFSAV